MSGMQTQLLLQIQYLCGCLRINVNLGTSSGCTSWLEWDCLHRGAWVGVRCSAPVWMRPKYRLRKQHSSAYAPCTHWRWWMFVSLKGYFGGCSGDLLTRDDIFMVTFLPKKNKIKIWILYCLVVNFLLCGKHKWPPMQLTSPILKP